MKKKGFISVKWEIMVLVIALAGAAIASLSIFAINYQEKALTKELETRGKGIADNMAVNIADFILRKDALESAKLVKKTLKNEGVRYAFAVNEKSAILVHNDMKMRKKKYKKPDGGSLTPSNNLLYTDEKGEKIIDFSAPILARGKVNLGMVHVGISYSIVEETIQKAFYSILVITLIVLVLSILGALMLGAAFAKPIQTLVKGTERAGTGDLDFKIRVKSKDELGILAAAFNKMTDDLRSAQDILINKKTMEKELDIAKDIQLSIIPKNIPQMQGCSAAAYYKAAKEVGGDYYDFIPTGYQRTCLAMGDVSGKGIPAAMVMSMTSVILHAYVASELTPKQMLMKLNDELKKKTTRGLFVTMFYGLLNAGTGQMDFVSAGHNETFVYRKATNEIETYVPGGFPILMGPTSMFGARLVESSVTLETGDTMVLFTDGVNEAMNKDQKEFGIEPFKQIISENALKSPQEMVDAIVKGVNDFVGDAVQSDDIAIMVIQKN